MKLKFTSGSTVFIHSTETHFTPNCTRFITEICYLTITDCRNMNKRNNFCKQTLFYDVAFIQNMFSEFVPLSRQTISSGQKLFDPINHSVDKMLHVMLLLLCNLSCGLEEPSSRGMRCFIAEGGRGVSRQHRRSGEQTPDRNVSVRLHCSTFNLCPDTTAGWPPCLGCPSHLAGVLLFWLRWRAIVVMTDEATGEPWERKTDLQNWKV